MLGGAGIPNTTTTGGGQLAYGASVTYSIDYARQLFTGNHSLSLEFPLAASPSHSVEGEARDGFPPPSNSITSLATLFVTPSFRLRLFDHARLSPWISGGFGYGPFEGSDLFRNGAPNPQIHKNTGTAQFGGGLDIHTPLKLWFPINLRAEVRDYYTLDSPSFVGAQGEIAQHHVVAGGGFVLRF